MIIPSQTMCHVHQSLSDVIASLMCFVQAIARVGDTFKVLVEADNRPRGNITLSTNLLEQQPEDMLHDRQAVQDNAIEAAAQLRQSVHRQVPSSYRTWLLTIAPLGLNS